MKPPSLHVGDLQPDVLGLAVLRQREFDRVGRVHAGLQKGDEARQGLPCLFPRRGQFFICRRVGDDIVTDDAAIVGRFAEFPC